MPVRPSGASTGKFAAVEVRRDGKKGYYTGLSVENAVENVNTKLAEAIVGENALDQKRIDEVLIRTDGTDNKSSVGAKAPPGDFRGGGKGGGDGAPHSALPVSWRLPCMQTSGPHDEYSEWGKACR